ncbi:hypothetical protein H8F21_13890 [Pseudomonas sp. P66]|uniref:Uncharacterized protein n=1 Tax=Pseudomonas arcuscaelestis TaxID=2710591 RepID=A0ABS2BYG3_9PSED|nr:hypothetical protein [Pseudomonas arcuscaelestis]MBM5458657.1 hypothetical protein [Pseudomonas arcuscaelestis]
MFSSKLGFVTARIFSVIALISSLVSLIALITYLLNLVEISSIFSRWFGTGTWLPFWTIVGAGVLALGASSITTRLMAQAVIVAEQERAMRE